MHGQQYKGTNKASKDRVQSPRNVQIREALKCYECEGVRHFARVSYTAQKGSQKHELAKKKGPGRSPKSPTFLGRKAPVHC